MDDIDRKVALITGASRGIGRAVAIALCQAGAHIAVNYRSQENKAQQVLDSIENMGGRGLVIKADVSRGQEVANMIRVIGNELGPVEILVNNAGIIRPQTLDEIREEDWDMIPVGRFGTAEEIRPCYLPTTIHNSECDP